LPGSVWSSGQAATCSEAGVERLRDFLVWDLLPKEKANPAFGLPCLEEKRDPIPRTLVFWN
jgi:hypothetical protein